MYQSLCRACRTPLIRQSLLISRFQSTQGTSTIHLTPAAIARLDTIRTKERNPKLALRIAVESGGCHGYQYKLDLEDLSDDHLLKKDDGALDADADQLIPPFTSSQDTLPYVIVDPISLDYTKGSTLDFATELIGSSFRIENNPQAQGAGCGCGVSFDMKEEKLF